MPFCQKCGHSLSGDAEFCAKCGHRVTSPQVIIQQPAPQPAPQQVQQQKVVVKTGRGGLGCCGSLLVLIVILYVYFTYVM